MEIGLVKLFKSAKATLSLIIIGAATAALFTGHMDGTAYAAVIATVSTIYNFVHAANDRAALQAVGNPSSVVSQVVANNPAPIVDAEVLAAQVRDTIVKQ